MGGLPGLSPFHAGKWIGMRQNRHHSQENPHASSAVGIPVSLPLPVAKGRPTPTSRPASPTRLISSPPVPSIMPPIVPVVPTAPVVSRLSSGPAIPVIGRDVRVNIRPRDPSPTAWRPIPITLSISLTRRIPSVSVIEGRRGPWRQSLLPVPCRPPLVDRGRRRVARITSPIHTVPAAITIGVGEPRVGPSPTVHRPSPHRASFGRGR